MPFKFKAGTLLAFLALVTFTSLSASPPDLQVETEQVCLQDDLTQVTIAPTLEITAPQVEPLSAAPAEPSPDLAAEVPRSIHVDGHYYSSTALNSGPGVEAARCCGGRGPDGQSSNRVDLDFKTEPAKTNRPRDDD